MVKNKQTRFCRAMQLALLLVGTLAVPVQAAVGISDPLGDTFLSTFGVGSDTHDITAMSADLAPSGNVALTVEFVDPISRPSDFALNSFDGFIDFDTDQNSAIGPRHIFGLPQHGARAVSHGHRSAADRIGHVEISDRRRECRFVHLARLAEILPRGGRYII